MAAFVPDMGHVHTLRYLACLFITKEQHAFTTGPGPERATFLAKVVSPRGPRGASGPRLIWWLKGTIVARLAQVFTKGESAFSKFFCESAAI